jgi:hypothetical protein
MCAVLISDYKEEFEETFGIYKRAIGNLACKLTVS